MENIPQKNISLDAICLIVVLYALKEYYAKNTKVEEMNPMKKTKNFNILILLLYLSIWLMGCSTNGAVENKAVLLEIQRPLIMSKTGEDDRPAWTTQMAFIENDGKLIYTGSVIGGADYTLTLRLAKAEATKNLLESIEIKARHEFSSSMNGSNMAEGDIGRYVTDTVAWTIDNLRIGGIKQRQIYYEQVFDPVAQSFKYNSWVQLEISKSDYTKAKANAAQRLLDKAVQGNDDEAREKALELLEKLNREV